MERYAGKFQAYVVDCHISGRRSLASIKVCDTTSGMAHDLRKKIKHDGQGRAQVKHAMWLQTQIKRLAWIEEQVAKVNKELDEGSANFAQRQERKTNRLMGVLDNLEGDTRDIITLLLLTGARKSNALSLRCSFVFDTFYTCSIAGRKAEAKASATNPSLDSK